MKKVITFGEIMLRLNPLGHNRFIQANVYDASFGGGEANVAVSLANFGLNSSFVTKVPAHEIGQAAVNELRKFGVNTNWIVRDGLRLGIYFLEKGASQRPSKVIYDRAGSAISQAEVEDFDWKEIFKDADWFHFTGITPALGQNLPAICEAACKAAKEQGVKISCDLNYRKKLWSRTEANIVMSRLMPYVDICIANEEDANDIFSIYAPDTDINSGNLSQSGYISVAKQLQDLFHFEKVAITLRGSLSASDNLWSGLLYADKQAYFSDTYNVHIVDRVGAGDSFGSGLIYSSLQHWDNQKIIDFAVAASCLKHSVEHDFNLASINEVESLVNGNASGRVQR